MSQVSEPIRKFFQEYERGSNVFDPGLLDTQYSETFMFAGPQGCQAVKRDDLLKVVPKRSEFFKTLGLRSSKIKSLEETRLDDNYAMVKAVWSMHFEKDPTHPITEEISATYILVRRAESLRIVLQLDHQDLMKRVQELGLAPAQK